ncbi:MAG: hypothetical protein A2252_08690 [Elusimicrobia bacterium RIFOXYA2_FULL_39_19]|nr:MAG: hypothetical protein A2252_08690 [Elusimicrobia bacterium RIFOXYA2_FULL_39_19]
MYQDTFEDYETAKITGEIIIKESLENIADNINTSDIEGQPLLIMNTLSWERKAPVRISLNETKFNNPCVFNENGEKIPAQVIDGENGKELLFVTSKISSLGYSVYRLSEAQPAGSRLSEIKTDKYNLENKYFKIEIDEKTGYLKKVYDKINKKNILNSPKGNMLQLLEDIPAECDSWEIKYTGKIWELGTVDDIKIVEKGPVRTVVRIWKSFSGQGRKKYLPPRVFEYNLPGIDFPSSFFVQDIILYNDLPRIDFQLKVDWWEDHLLLKTVFPVNVKNSKASYEIPGASIERPTTFRNSWEKARYEVPVLKWADLSDSGYGVSLINDSKYGMDIHENIIRLTLLKSSATFNEPLSTPDPVSDRGKHIINYSILPHKKTWKEAETQESAFEFNYPLFVHFMPKHKGKLPKKFSLLNISPHLIVTSFKKADVPGYWILRLYETCGKNTNGAIKFSCPVEKIHETSMLEDIDKKLDTNMNRIRLKVEKNKIKTLKLKIKN